MLLPSEHPCPPGSTSSDVNKAQDSDLRRHGHPAPGHHHHHHNHHSNGTPNQSRSTDQQSSGKRSRQVPMRPTCLHHHPFHHHHGHRHDHAHIHPSSNHHNEDEEEEDDEEYEDEDECCYDDHEDEEEEEEEEEEDEEEDGSDDDDGQGSTTSSNYNNPRDLGRVCDCCYCEVFGHGVPALSTTSRNYSEMRERLRMRLSKRKAEKKAGGLNGVGAGTMNGCTGHGNDCSPSGLVPSGSSTTTTSMGGDGWMKKRENVLNGGGTGVIKDNRDVEELLSFINGTDSKKDSSKSKKDKKKKKKEKPKDTNGKNDPSSSLANGLDEQKASVGVDPSASRIASQTTVRSASSDPSVGRRKGGTDQNESMKHNSKGSGSITNGGSRNNSKSGTSGGSPNRSNNSNVSNNNSTGSQNESSKNVRDGPSNSIPKEKMINNKTSSSRSVERKNENLVLNNERESKNTNSSPSFNNKSKDNTSGGSTTIPGSITPVTNSKRLTETNNKLTHNSNSVNGGDSKIISGTNLTESNNKLTHNSNNLYGGDSKIISGKNLTTTNMNGIHEQSNKVDNHHHHSNNPLNQHQILKGSSFVQNQVRAGGKDSKGLKGGKRGNGSSEEKSTISPEEVFLPKDVNHEHLDEFEKELEEFKRFCFNSKPLPKIKPKVNIDLKDILGRK